MTQLEVLLAGVILAIVGHGIIVLYRSPKEAVQGHRGKDRWLEDNHATLDRMLTRHDEVVKNLVSAIDRLTHRIDKIEPHIRQPGGRRGG